MQSPEAITRRAERERAAYLAAIGRPSVFAPAVPPVSEWVRRAQEAKLPVKVYGR